MSDVDRAAMALMDKMSADGHEVNYTQCREYAALALAAAGLPHQREGHAVSTDDYDRLAKDHHGTPSAEVAIVIRTEDGQETTAAVLHDASVVLETAKDVGGLGWMSRPTVVNSVHQMRVTTTSGYTLYDSPFFAHRPQIEGEADHA